ncbi:aminopeptidase Ecym_8027 [Eremothecium cymbalariae DBVPG|uniref:Aminopeptidase P N-terminal domain-containing protein n=1 Tax=Eremothecium cymbalariae (strain CBS 270.75 / DBVPG 7215 / KCTC 17166 / NRRL Y-17582) TaxID=931890 RepID=G8JWU9_ERECY|nr:Hypothetical protein Ecym_8027 [Eremothecium cymbalariae DBVPG\
MFVTKFNVVKRLEHKHRLFSSMKPSLYNKLWLNRAPVSINAGQPLHENRPNLLKHGELTPGITAMEYFDRRSKLMSNLPVKSCAIVVGAQLKYASGPVFYKFQQNNDLFYLSGWNEPDSVLVLEKPTSNIDDVVFHMIVPPTDPATEQWDGFRTGPVGACEIFNADSATDVSDSTSYLSKIIKRNETVYFDVPVIEDESSDSVGFTNFFLPSSQPTGTKTIMDILKNYVRKGGVKELKPILAQLRSIKSPAEIRLIRRAGQISGRAFNQAYAKRFRNERTLNAFLEYKFISGGCEKPAYVPVIGAGANALCIHYTRNDDVMYDDEMVLVDAAGSIGGYCADISRTWPVNGKFTEPQRDLYEAVLAVQRRCVDLCFANKGYSLHQIHQKSMEFMKQELANIGLPSLRQSDITRLYPHYIGHNLGLDVHDVPEISRYQPLKEGQVITIEPGLYVPDSSEYPEYFRNIGIRIEDNIAIDLDSYRNLSVEAAKEIVDIESIVQNGVSTQPNEDVVSPLEVDYLE